MIGLKRGAGIAATAIFFLSVLTHFASASPAPATFSGASPAISPVASHGASPAPLPRIHLAQASAPATPPAQPAAAARQSIGTVATLKGTATVTRDGTASPLKLNDEIYDGDTVRTGPGGAIGITLEDETTFNMGASAVMVMDNFVYESGGAANAGLFNVVRGTIAFAAGQIAHTGDMKIATPTATLGIRGTTGVIDVPDNATTPGDVAIKLYNDADGRLGRIEVFGPGPNGARLGVLDRAASGFSIRPGAGGRFSAFAFQVPPQQMTRDRGFVGQLFRSRDRGRQLMIQRRNFRQQNLQRGPGQQRGPGNLRQRNNPRQQNFRQPPRQPRQNFRDAPGYRQSPGAPPRGQSRPDRRGERFRQGGERFR